MSKKRVIFYRESTLRFHLRAPKTSRPTLIFLATCIDGKRYKISTKVRVYANQWDQERQLAVISNVQSKQDNRNNTIANNQLNKLRGYFSEFIEYICNNNVDDIAETLKKFINRDMAKKKINLVYIAADALEYYHSYVKPSIKDSTKRQSESLLSEFGRFVDTLREKDKTMQIFSQRGLNMYKEYLIDKMNKSKDDDSMRNFGVGQLNRCGAIIALLINKVLVPQEKAPSPVVWIKVDDPRREDQMGHIPLLDNEVAAIESCSGLTPVEEEYRDVFLLHLECGQRVSDLAKLLTGNYKVKQGKKYKYIVVSTTKENINAIIPITPKVTMLMDKIKNHTLVDPKEFEEKTKGKGNNTYNEAIRRIAKKAGLDREIVKIDSTQKEVRKPLYKTLSSHDARCTFITNMIRKGVSPERLCRMTGHANDEMIKRVYAQLTVEDEINRIESDLYSDVDDDEAPTNLHQLNSDISEKILSEKNQTSDLESSNNIITNELDVIDNYIKGLNNELDAAIAESYTLVPENGENEIYSDFKESQDIYKSLFEKLSLDSTEGFFAFWHEFEAEFNANAINDPDYEKLYLHWDKLDVLSYLIDYSEKIQIGGILTDELKSIFRKISEENLNALYLHQFIRDSRVIIPIMRYVFVFCKVMCFVCYNRPFVDDTFIDNNSYALSRIPDWKIVFKELKKIQVLQLQAMIQNTSCEYDVKVSLYNSIVTSDVNNFIKTIQSNEREAYSLITAAYAMHFLGKTLEYVYSQLNNIKEGVTGPLDFMDSFQGFVSINNPYLNTNVNEHLLSFNVDSDLTEYYLSRFDFFREIYNKTKDHMNSLEIKVLNRLTTFINNHPELEKAYEKYKSKQDISSYTGNCNLIKKRTNSAFVDLEIFKTEIDYTNYNPRELLPTLNSGIKEGGDIKFKDFINYLAHSSCIDDDDAVKQLLVYRLTGKCRPEGDLGKIPWNPDKLKELAFVIMYSTTNSSGKYNKVRDFFEGPNYPDDISSIRTIANSASLEFRRKLYDLYPKVFKLKV